jgi:phage protein D
MVDRTADRTGPAEQMSDPALPGTRFYAPQARFVSANGSPILDGDRPVHVDLVSARVTQTHHGVSQVSLTLNNQRHTADGRPIYPPWRYNRLDILRFGQRVRVQFRYGNEAWTPMILARITDIAFTFPQSGGAQLTLQGEDLLSLLKTKPAADKRYQNTDEVAIVNDVLSQSRSRAGADLRLADASNRLIFKETLTTVTHRRTQSYLQFIQSLAERLDYEVFVDFVDPNDENSPVRLHFEPARSFDLNGLVDLTWNKDLVEFRPKFKVWEVCTDAVASGRNPRHRRRVDEAVLADRLRPDLHAAPGEATPITAIEARSRFFGGENNSGGNTEPGAVSNLDPERTRAKAAAELLKSAREFLTAEISTIGFTSIRPGIHINIRKLYPPFDGIYYVTQAVHTLDANGYQTQCSLRRPGMLDPSSYPTGGAP